MSQGTTLSILGLYDFDSSLFSEMVYPAGFSAADKQTIVQNILVECAELEILFPDPKFCKKMIGLWSKLNISVWNRIFTAANLEYNPIENYNKTEIETISNDRTDTHSGTDINQSSGSDSQQLSSSGTETNSGTDSNTASVTAYDSNQLYVHDKNEYAHGHIITDSNSGSNSTTYGKKDSYTHGEKIVSEGDITRENHTTGNIGVTTSQQMLEQEIEIAAKLNVMKMIVESFKERFCILVY